MTSSFHSAAKMFRYFAWMIVDSKIVFLFWWQQNAVWLQSEYTRALILRAKRFYLVLL